MITVAELKTIKAPFQVKGPDGDVATIKGFSRNDPLGVGGGMLPDMPTVYFEKGGWLLLEDLMRHYELVGHHHKTKD